MAGERLPLNIFQGVLPGSYIFMDNMDDDSKWIQSATTPWTGIAVGDIYGYMGKGINFNGDSAWDAPPWTASRRVLAPLTGDYFFGIVFRANKIITGSGNRSLQLNYYISGSTSNKETLLSLKLDVYKTNAPVSDVLNIKILNSAGLYVDVLSSSYSNLGKNYVGFEPWVRATFTIQNKSLVQTNLNGINYSSSISIYDATLAPGTAYTRGRLDLIGNKADVVVEAVSWDIDQIWISDTENRV